MNHHEISRDDSFDGSQDEKCYRRHYKDRALWFELELEVVRLVKDTKKKNQIKDRQTDRKVSLMLWQFWFTSKAAERGNNKL